MALAASPGMMQPRPPPPTMSPTATAACEDDIAIIAKLTAITPKPTYGKTSRQADHGAQAAVAERGSGNSEVEGAKRNPHRAWRIHAKGIQMERHLGRDKIEANAVEDCRKEQDADGEQWNPGRPAGTGILSFVPWFREAKQHRRQDQKGQAINGEGSPPSCPCEQPAEAHEQEAANAGERCLQTHEAVAAWPRKEIADQSSGSGNDPRDGCAEQGPSEQQRIKSVGN